LTDCVFTSNNAQLGGGAQVTTRGTNKRSAGDKITISNASFANNNASNGAGLVISTTSQDTSDNSAVVSDSQFESNTATGMGGAVMTSSGVDLKAMTFDGNKAAQGSAVAVSSTTGSATLNTLSSTSDQNIYLTGDAMLYQTSSVVMGCPSSYKSTSNDDGGMSCTLTSLSNASDIAVPSTNSQRDITPIIVGCIVAFVVILLAVIALVMYRIRANRSIKKFMSSIDMSTFLPQFQKNTIINENELKNMKQIGRGAFGVVYRAQWRSCDVAVKQLINQDMMEQEHIEAFVREVQLLESLRPHPNLVLFLGIIQPPNLSLVTEFCEGGDLLTYIRKMNPELSFRKIWLSDIASAMLHLHNENIIHRDLAARNILLTGALRAKVTDFGFSRQIESSDTQSKTSSDVGPLKWMAPEALVNRTYSNKSDVYSFSINVGNHHWRGSVPWGQRGECRHRGVIQRSSTTRTRDRPKNNQVDGTVLADRPR